MHLGEAGRVPETASGDEGVITRMGADKEKKFHAKAPRRKEGI
jgi:hypothetical protein